MLMELLSLLTILVRYDARTATDNQSEFEPDLQAILWYYHLPITCVNLTFGPACMRKCEIASATVEEIFTGYHDHGA
jgi:hypothetical protein